MMSLRNTGATSPRGLPVLLIIPLTILTQVRSQSLPPERPKTETVRGTVINAVTQAPIPRALVLTPDNRIAVLTDGEGHFELTLPKQDPGTGSFGSFIGSAFSAPRLYARHGESFFLVARKPGFLDDVGSTKSNAAQSSSDELIIALMPEAIIKGRITLASGDAALGIMVQLFSRQVVDGLPRWTQGEMARANSSGEFRFAELRPGSYRLVTREFMDNDPVTNVPGAQQYGYPPVYYPGASDFPGSSTIELTGGQEFEADLSLTRRAYYPVHIPIANAQGTDLNVSVQGQRGPGYSLGYNAIEPRVEGLLPNGNYVIEASSFGQNSVSGTVAIHVTGAPVDGPAMTLVPASSIQLNVKEEFADTSWNSSGGWTDGRHTFALHGPRLYLNATVESVEDITQGQFSGQMRSPTGPNDDSMVIENLVPGRYWLRLHTGRGYIASATQGSTDLLRQPLTIGSGPAAPIEVTVRDDVAELDGTVTALAQPSTRNAEAAESGQVMVYCVPLPDSSGEFTQLGVSSDGKFTSPQMAPGDYRILAFYGTHEQLPYRDREAMKAYESNGTVVHLSAGQKATVQVQTILSE